MAQGNHASARELLLQSIEQQIFPVLRGEGYTGPIASSQKIKGRRMYSFDFRKLHGDGRWRVIEINVKTFERPTFEIYGGAVPIAGVRMLCPDEVVPPELVTASMLETRNFLQASPTKGTSVPFRPSLFALLLNKQKAIEEVVIDAAQKLPNLFAFIENEKVSSLIWSHRNRIGHG